MKKLIFLLVITCLIVGCTSEEDKIKQSACQYVQAQMKDPSSFKADSVTLVEDSIPFYFNSKVRIKGHLAQEYSHKLYNISSFAGVPYLSSQYDATKKVYEDILDSLQVAYQEAKRLCDGTLYKMVLIKSTANNSYGNPVQGKYIVIFNKNKPYELITSFSVKSIVDDYFDMRLFIEEEKERIKFDDYGKIIATGLTPVETFIFK